MADAATSARERVEAKLVEKATADPAFRARLVADPKSVVGEELGTTLPEGLDVRVVEETGTTLYLVLPAAERAEGELSDAELEGVAGAGTGSGDKDWSSGGSWEFAGGPGGLG